MRSKYTSILIFFLIFNWGELFSQTQNIKGKQLANSPLRVLQKDSLLKDLKLLEQALTELHPGLYRYNFPETIQKSFADLGHNLPDQVLETEFLKRLAQTITKVRCGHTYLNPWNMKRELRERILGGEQFFPIGFKVIEGRFYVTENASENVNIQRGAEIMSINDIPIQTIYDSLKTIAKSDGNNFAPVDSYLSLKDYRERAWQTFDIYFPLFFPLPKNSFKILYKNYGSEKAERIEVKALTKSKRAEKMQTKYGKAVLENKEWKLDILSPELAIMKLGTFAIWNWKDFDQEKWFADAFAKLDSLSIETLAIDIRGNGGGLGEPANELISYLIKDTLRCDDLGKVYIRTTKLNPDLIPYIDTWAQPLIDGLANDMYKEVEDGYYEFLEPSECTDIIPKAKHFQGKTYIFGGPSNVSATFTLLDKANNFDFAEYVGQASGGNQQGINGGVYAFFYLPYSKMEVDIPLKYFAPSKPRPDAGVQPKYNLKFSQKDIAENKDVYLEYVKKRAYK